MTTKPGDVARYRGLKLAARISALLTENSTLTVERDALRAENARLREGLGKIATATGGNGIPFANKWARSIAEDALGDEIVQREVGGSMPQKVMANTGEAKCLGKRNSDTHSSTQHSSELSRGSCDTWTGSWGHPDACPCSLKGVEECKHLHTSPGAGYNRWCDDCGGMLPESVLLP